jgi:hypothetical protein
MAFRVVTKCLNLSASDDADGLLKRSNTNGIRKQSRLTKSKVEVGKR